VTPPVSAAVQRYVTHFGEHAAVTFADGSRAILGPATTMSVAYDSVTGGTIVTATGQILFRVMHKNATPFTVRIGPVLTQVLGTEFVVRRYETDRTTRIVVADGRVAVRGTHDLIGMGSARGSSTAVLSARTLCTVTDSGIVHVTPNIAIDEYTGWTTGRLVFRETPARDVIAELGRVYGVAPQLADSALADHPITWTVFTATQSRDEVFSLLAALLNAHISRAGNTMTIIPSRAPMRRSIRPMHSFLPESQYGR
jgi:transmembrane sensor